MVRLSARAITGTTFTVRQSRRRNSMSRGRRLLRQDGDGDGSGGSKRASEGSQPSAQARGPSSAASSSASAWLLPAPRPHQCPVGGTKYTQQCTRVSGMCRWRVMRSSSCRYCSYCPLM